MNRHEVIAKVNDLMHSGFEVPADKLVPTATLFQDLGLDSLDAIDMMVHLEERLGLKIEVDKMSSVKTLEDVYNLVATFAMSNNGNK